MCLLLVWSGIWNHSLLVAILYPIWVSGHYSERGANSWRRDTSMKAASPLLLKEDWISYNGPEGLEIFSRDDIMAFLIPRALIRCSTNLFTWYDSTQTIRVLVQHSEYSFSSRAKHKEPQRIKHQTKLITTRPSNDNRHTKPNEQTSHQALHC